MFPDLEDTCLSYYEHAVLCRNTRSLFLLQEQSIPYELIPVPK
jgi:hypothetical protein